MCGNCRRSDAAAATFIFWVSLGLVPKLNLGTRPSLSIPVVSSEKQKPVERLVERILSAKQRDVGLRSEASSRQAGADVSAFEREIDDLVYALYGLTPEEIQLVEGAK